jgi:hypothetical protein
LKIISEQRELELEGKEEGLRCRFAFEDLANIAANTRHRRSGFTVSDPRDMLIEARWGNEADQARPGRKSQW